MRNSKTQQSDYYLKGQLEFTGGGWSMADEAASHYSAFIDNMSLGLRILNETFGECGRPTVAWQIDPFGHSKEAASIFTQLGFEGLFFCRLDYRDKARRKAEQELEMVWEASTDLGGSADLFTHVLYNEYGPPPGFCWDLPCDDEPISVGEDGNLEERVDALVAWVKEQASHYRTNHVILTMGEDFQYQAAHSWFLNLDRVMANINARGEELGLTIYYSTPSCYLKAVRETETSWPRESGDFLPYASDEHSYWSGFFTSRPSSKFLIRQAEKLSAVADRLGVQAGSAGEGAGSFQGEQGVQGGAGEGAQSLHKAVAVVQHHDAITGTEKERVASDYHQRLHSAVGAAFLELGLEPSYDRLSSRDSFCPLLNISQCPMLDSLQADSPQRLQIFNPLARTVQPTIRCSTK